MRTRPIPSSGEQLPIVGLGTWQQFDVGNDPAYRTPLKKVLSNLFRTGGSVIDSSPMYGRAERVVGSLLESMQERESAFLATKVWTRGKQSGIDQMNRSMEKLNASTIDLMQVHNLVDWQTHLDTLTAWKEEDRVRYVGVTHYTQSAFDNLETVMKQRDIDFVQLPYSIGFRAAEKRLLPLAEDRGIAVLINRPFQAGGLFRTIRGESLPEWVNQIDCESWAQYFLKFILGHPAVTCVIPGTSNPEHMLDNARAGVGKLPDSDQRERMHDYWTSIS
jgi:diketogulonate reductase-like aldo/keto reductase